MSSKQDSPLNQQKRSILVRTASIAQRFESGTLGRYLLSRRTQMGIDLLLCLLSFIIAHLLRFDGWPPSVESRRMFLLLPYVAVGRVLTNYAAGIYQRIWRYASIPDATRLAFSVSIVSSILVCLRLGLVGIEPYLTIPIGIIVIDYILATAGMLGVRLLRRVTFETATRRAMGEPDSRQRVLLVGAGDAGVMAAREIARRPDLGVEICGFVDDDRKKQKTIIHGVRVLGVTSDLPALVKQKQIGHVIITMANVPRRTIRRIMDICESAHVTVKIIPGLYEILGDHVTVSNIRPVEIEDLLGRDTIDINSWLETTRKTFTGKNVLVTGAGGSIGKELCHQLVALNPASIILLDKDENAVFEAETEIRELVEHRSIEIHPVICDLRLSRRVEKVFELFRPQVVFHAAAHKHVPLMEVNASEAVLNNIVGTARLLDVCALFNVYHCVMVSTDKAVNPTSVMGATKRVSELLFQACAARLEGAGRYSCVRFGNVLGSRGSVIPTFREQIKKGGPITITHQDMIRYFMTIPEAAQLIIQAGAIGERGEIFLLDMGEPVRVLDLAQDMIRLSGLTVGEDIEIQITGMRPGEKLREELLIAEEGAQATRYEKIFVAPALDYDFSRLQRWVKALEEAAYAGDDNAIFEIFSEMSIGFQSSRRCSEADLMAISYSD